MSAPAKIPQGWGEVAESAPGLHGDRVEINGKWYEADFPGFRSPRYHRYIRRANHQFGVGVYIEAESEDL